MYERLLLCVAQGPEGAQGPCQPPPPEPWPLFFQSGWSRSSPNGRPQQPRGLHSRLLLRTCDDDGRRSLTDEEIHDESMTFLCAGYETTAGALSWALLLLCQHPEVQEQLAQQVRGLRSDCRLSVEDLEQLPLATEIFMETLRLYPPTWAIARRLNVDSVLEGAELQAGSLVILALYSLHRSPEYWSDPEVFRPSRFAGAPQHEPDAYQPFISGGRACIGRGLAMREGPLTLASLVGRYRFRLPPGQSLRPHDRHCSMHRGG